MTVGQLKAALVPLPDHLEITVRCMWEGDEPNGNCFALHSAVEDETHGSGVPFVALDCDQEFDDFDAEIEELERARPS